MNYLLNVKTLRNEYYIQRHGESSASKKKMILSHPVDGQSIEFALTEFGKEQTKQSARKALKNKWLDDQTIIYSSNFSRTRQTAAITRKILGAPPVNITNKLRERFFGKWERTENKNYVKVWENDAKDYKHKINEVESVDEILSRVTALILSLEHKYNGRKILLVSHGDTLQILQTAFAKIHPSHHPSSSYLGLAEIRILKF